VDIAAASLITFISPALYLTQEPFLMYRSLKNVTNQWTKTYSKTISYTLAALAFTSLHKQQTLQEETSPLDHAARAKSVIRFSVEVGNVEHQNVKKLLEI
jgi:hypothetical protein